MHLIPCQLEFCLVVDPQILLALVVVVVVKFHIMPVDGCFQSHCKPPVCECKFFNALYSDVRSDHV